MGSIIINGVTGEVCYRGKTLIMSEAIADKFDETACLYKRTADINGIKIYSISYEGIGGIQPLIGIVGKGIDESNQANGYLIAAAPDMYEALKAIHEQFGYSLPEAYKELIEKALQKARGEGE